MDKKRFWTLRKWDVVGSRNRAVVHAYCACEAKAMFLMNFGDQSVLAVFEGAPVKV